MRRLHCAFRAPPCGRRPSGWDAASCNAYPLLTAIPRRLSLGRVSEDGAAATQVAIRLADELLARIDEFRSEIVTDLPGHRFTRTDAIRVLLERGLEASARRRAKRRR